MIAGNTYGKFEIRREIARGGMGTLYEAWDTVLGRRVALKAIHPELCSNPVIASQIVVEARATAAVEHPNIVHIHGIETLDGQTVIDMEYLAGTTIEQLIAKGPLSSYHTVSLLLQILEGLAACHRRGIVHCDLKPANVIVNPQGRAILTDFGLAAAVEGAGSLPGDKRKGLRWGTPAYSPPEAWTGGPVAPTWDIYCAGVLAYECLTGQVPRTGAAPGVPRSGRTAVTRLSLSAHGEPPTGAVSLDQDTPAPTGNEVQVALKETSPELERLIQSMLSLDPKDRPKDADAALRLLRSCSEAMRAVPRVEASSFSHTSSASEAPRPTPVFRNRVLWIAVLGLLAAQVVLLVVDRFHHGPTAVQLPAGKATNVPEGSSSPEDITPASEFIYFSADDGILGREPYAVEAGGGHTYLMEDLVPGMESSQPHGLRAYRGGILFNATTPESGSELYWAAWTFGTSYSVRQVADIVPGPMGSNPQIVAVMGTVALFYANTPAYGRELWSTMGTSETTAIVKDIFEGPADSVPTSPRVIASESQAYAVALTDVQRGNCLWRYQAKDNSLRLVADVAENTQHMTFLGDALLFAQEQPEAGAELWGCDGDHTPPYLLIDLLPGKEGSDPSQLFTWGTWVFFQARTPALGHELWKTDGTAEGTALIKDIHPGPGDSDPYGFVAGDHGVFFSADDGTHGRELWFSDGSPEGTLFVADICPGEKPSTPYNLTPHADAIFFSANDGTHGEELWRAAPTQNGWEARMLADIYPGQEGSEPYGLKWQSKDLGIFAATAPGSGRELYGVHTNDLEVQLKSDIHPNGR